MELKLLWSYLQRAQKSFNAILANASRASGDAAPIALAYAQAELNRNASNSVAIALHVLTWISQQSTPFQPLSEKNLRVLTSDE